MSDRDYQVHVVSEEVYDKVNVGDNYAFGTITNGVYCPLTDKLLVITYHGPDPAPAGQVISLKPSNTLLPKCRECGRFPPNHGAHCSKRSA